MNCRNLRTESLCRHSKKIKKTDDESYWQKLEKETGAQFGKVIHPKRILECYEQKKSFIYLVEDNNGKRKLVPDIYIEENWPQFMVSYYENLIEFT